MIDEWGFFMKRMMDFEIEDQAFVVFYLNCSWNIMIKLKTKKKEKEINLSQRMASWKKCKRSLSFHTKVS